jgi:hypothetical protein
MENIKKFKQKLNYKNIFISWESHQELTIKSLDNYLNKKYHLYDYDIKKIIDLLLYDFSKYDIKDRLQTIYSLKKDSNSKNSFIIRYGEAEGEKRYRQRLKQQRYTSSKEYLIKTFGNDIGNKILKMKCPNNLCLLIEKYGEIEGTKKYNEYLKNYKHGNSLDGYIEKYGEIEGTKKYNERQKMYEHVNSLNYYLEKFGENVGRKKWNEKNKKIKYTRTKQYYIQKLGKEKGEEFYKILRKSMSCSLENCIKRLGKEKGEEFYKQWIKKINNKFKGYSKISIEFIESLLMFFSFKECYYGENEFMFLIKDSLIKNPRVDLYIKDINLIIEFFGDIYHANPDIFKEEDFPHPFNKHLNAKQIREFDELRINLIKKKYNCDVIIVWEKDYKENKQETINKIVNLIKEKYEL